MHDQSQGCVTAIFSKEKWSRAGLFWSLGGWGLPLKKFHQLRFWIHTQKFQKEIGLLTSALRQKCNPDFLLDTWRDFCRFTASGISVQCVGCVLVWWFMFLMNITNELMQDMAFIHVYQGIQTEINTVLAVMTHHFKPQIKSSLAVVLLMARDIADSGLECHTRATHSTLTVSQRSPVMLVGVPPELTLISVQTVVTAKKKRKL